MTSTQSTLDVTWRIEGARIIAALARFTGDVGRAEDLVSDATLEALATWPDAGVPRNPAAWLTAVAKRRAIDSWRRDARLAERYAAMAQELDDQHPDNPADALEAVDDDVLRLVFIACHPVLSRESQVALTLRIVAGLTTTEIGRMLLAPVATVQARITRAKRTLAEAHVPFESPEPTELRERLAGVLSVVYLIFTEGYAATTGDTWMRRDLAREALRLGRTLAGLMPREPEVFALVALMEFQSSRFASRTDAAGQPVLLADQDRARWDHAQIRRGSDALKRADALGRGRGAYALQAAIAECHSRAPSIDDTDWDRVVVLYEALGRLAPNPIVDLNRAVAVSMATGPASALQIVDDLAAAGSLAGTHLLPSVRGELLAQLGRHDEARAEFESAAALTGNEREAEVLRGKAQRLN
ncbi:RNA polymerase sigma factor [Paramicrobacterium chengjingii]|uniref:RNA polymerase sigma factor n=1 Tax=Paramicrobacterium chengjingii TaxID=2769067 RepID=A0ABX6YIQ7_9MICO|nr:RNA polymerase sigma factor [Microbacterium chengjingii]QPZ38637.1 RNA polymerase sigma factor [Microbacterium chengjingii]